MGGLASFGGGILGAASALVLDPVLAVVFPSRCAGCGGSLGRPSRGPLCEGCWRLVPRHRAVLCRCGVPLPAATATAACARCRRGLAPFSAGWSLGPYEGVLRTLVHELKYRARRRVAERLAERVCGDEGARGLLEHGAVLVPVPLHPRRLRERGFNQSELLAAAIARRSGLALAPRALVRRKDTRAQAGLRAGERRRNVAGAFAVRQRGRVAGRAVVLVDDVLTTGATARACAGELKSAGARSVTVLTVARAL